MGEGVFELLSGILFNPVSTFKKITQEKPLALALAVYVIVNCFTSYASTMVFGGEFFGRARLGVLGMCVFSIPVTLFSIFALCALYHLVALLFKLEGNYLGLVSGIGFADIPLIFIGPLAFLSKLMGTFVGILIFGLLSLPLTVWVIILHIITIRENYSTTTGKAAFIYIIPLVLLLLLSIALVVLFVLLFAGSFH